MTGDTDAGLFGPDSMTWRVHAHPSALVGGLRALLVQASWTLWRSKHAEGLALRTWAHALAARRGRRIAVVALARRLSRILYAMWRDHTDFAAPPGRTRVAA